MRYQIPLQIKMGILQITKASQEDLVSIAWTLQLNTSIMLMTKIESPLHSLLKILTVNILLYHSWIPIVNHKLNKIYLIKSWNNKYYINVCLLCALETWWCKILHLFCRLILNPEKVVGVGVAQTLKILILMMSLWYYRYFQSLR